MTWIWNGLDGRAREKMHPARHGHEVRWMGATPAVPFGGGTAVVGFIVGDERKRVSPFGLLLGAAFVAGLLLLLAPLVLAGLARGRG